MTDIRNSENVVLGSPELHGSSPVLYSSEMLELILDIPSGRRKKEGRQGKMTSQVQAKVTTDVPEEYL